MTDIPLWRLYLLRALYLLVVVGLGLVVWPDVLQRSHTWALMEGVVACMLAAFSLMSLLGLRYPLQMLPVLLWELVWKLLWLGIVAWPQWRAGGMDAATWNNTVACLWVAIVPFVIPWRYVFAHYLKKPADRWA